MITSILVSGEGATDLGISISGNGVANETDILPGPMLLLLYKLIRQHSPQWYQEYVDWSVPLPIPTFLVSRSERARTTKLLRPNLFQTHINGRGGIEHAKSAWAMATLANQTNSNLLVYFHDTDGTRSILDRTPNLQSVIVSAAQRGFSHAAAAKGVAMVPKPTSEAWLLCHTQNNYRNCALIETELAGNQDSPDRSPKVILSKIVGETNRETLGNLASEIDTLSLDMPSFNCFSSQINKAIEEIFKA